VNKLRESRMNAMYLQLLTACCSCQGSGVDGNQCKVTSMIFEGQDTEDIVIRVQPVEGHRLPHTWNDKSLYIPSSYFPQSQASSRNAVAQVTAEMKGDSLMTSLPMLMLTFKAPETILNQLSTDDSTTTGAPNVGAMVPASVKSASSLNKGPPQSAKFQLRSASSSTPFMLQNLNSQSSLSVSSFGSASLLGGPGASFHIEGAADNFAPPATPATPNLTPAATPAPTDGVAISNVADGQSAAVSLFEKQPSTPGGQSDRQVGSAGVPSSASSSYRPHKLPPLDSASAGSSRPGTSQQPVDGDASSSKRPISNSTKLPGSAQSVKQQPLETVPESLKQAADAVQAEAQTQPQAPPAASPTQKSSHNLLTFLSSSSLLSAGSHEKDRNQPSSAAAKFVKSVSFHYGSSASVASAGSAGPGASVPPIVVQPLPFVSGSLDEFGYYRYDALTLFGEMGLNAKDEFSLVSSVGNASIGKQQQQRSSARDGSDKPATTGVTSPLAVASYFIAQVFLGAEMCLDRNYVAMHTLDERFPYDILVALVRMDISDKLKAAACRMLLCLHVDRDPQSSARIPSLSRSWKTVEAIGGDAGEEKDNYLKRLPSVDKALVNQFALIQEFISEHMRSMNGHRWGELSRHMLVLCKKLVFFNFYGSVDKLNDVIKHLIMALNRKEAEKEYEMTTAGPRSKSAATARGRSKKNRSGVGSPSHSNHENSMSLLAKDNPNGSGGEEGSLAENEFNKPTSIASKWYVVYSPWHLVRSTISWMMGRGGANGASAAGMRKDKWKSPLRYIKTSPHEIETMLEAVDILSRCQKIIEDRNLTLLLRSFYLWQSGKSRDSPGNMFESVCTQSKDLTLGVENFDAVFVDILMFSSNALVQRGLELLMAHHSSRSSLLRNSRTLQLMISPKHEKLFATVDTLLQTLERNAETHELWGELQSESDLQTNTQTKAILVELCQLTRVRRYVFDVDGEYAPDVDTQNLYRNLGCFQICMKVLALLDSLEDHYIDDNKSTGSGALSYLSDSNKQLDEAGQNIVDLCKLCNELLVWFLYANPENQTVGFTELDAFIEMLDVDVDSHLVIDAILKNNEKLMRLVPHSYLFELAEKIVNSEPNERSFKDLYLFASITNVGDINIKENQLEIIKQLCSPGRLPLVSCFFVPVDSEEYALKVELMEPFQGKFIVVQ
jgi:hypothetical protein